MTVRELMAQVDVDRVIDAFFLLDYDFSETNYESNFFDKYEAFPRMRQIIKDNIRLFAESQPDENSEQYTIFIWYSPDEEDFEGMGKMVFTSFATSDTEIVQAATKGSALEFTSYSYASVSMSSLAAYKIAGTSIEELGKEVCAAKVLSEIFWWGAYPEDREENFKKLLMRAARPITERDIIDSKTFEERMKVLDEEIWQSMSEDEREYRRLQQEFEAKTKEIRARYESRKTEEFRKRIEDAIKKEYLLDTYNKCCDIVFDNPFFYALKTDRLERTISGWLFNEELRDRSEEVLNVRFNDVEYSYQILERLGSYWGGWDGTPEASRMAEVAKRWYERYGAELVRISHDTLTFTCRKLTGSEAEGLRDEAVELNALIIDCKPEEILNYLMNKETFTLWWD